MQVDGATQIEHSVTRFDTLAGVAIKYGVEVADIKRMNGLVTDLQMFAHKKLQIPLPGRHPPSSDSSNGSLGNGYHTPPQWRNCEMLDSLQSLGLKVSERKVSPAMSKLQGYYGLASKMGSIAEGTEMTAYSRREALNLEDKIRQKLSPYSEPHLGRHRKSRSYANGFFQEIVDLNEDVTGDPLENDRYQNERFVRRRQKVETDPPRTPEILMEENGGGFNGRATKNLAPRPKSNNRVEQDAGRPAASPFGNTMINGHSLVRKSSSTSNLQESERSLWPTSKLISKVDAISRPIFDGVPKPLPSRRNKAALD